MRFSQQQPQQHQWDQRRDALRRHHSYRLENLSGHELGIAQCFAGDVSGGTAQLNDLLSAHILSIPTGPFCRDLAGGDCANNPTPVSALSQLRETALRRPSQTLRKN